MERLKHVQELIKALPEGLKGKVSDGYHTFDELYEFRMLYNAMFANLLAEGVGVGAIWQEIDVYKSLRHDDGSLCFGGGWFVVVIKLMTGKQISNHYPIADWDLFHIPERHSAINFDGHTSADVIERMREFLEFSK